LSNRDQNRQFRDAVREIERIIGRELTAVDWERLHREVSGMAFTFGEIVEIGIAMFG
jgi:hypothetical protein